MKCFAARITIFIACGVLATILTSWASAYWIRSQTFSSTEIGTSDWVRAVPASWPQTSDTTTIYNFSFAECYWQTNKLYSLDQDFVLYDYRFGWPMNAMSYQVAFQWNRVNGKVDQTMGWFADGIPLRSQTHPDWRLPVRPDTVPFAINTLTYSTAFFLLFTGAIQLVKVTRWGLRIRRGLCHKCGYDLAGLDACPECNTPAPQKALAT